MLDCILSEPLISVIMSVRNGESTLDESIGSILNQTIQEWEFIVCDDGSSDNTYKMLLEYASSDSRFIILRNQESMGLAYSLNRCIEVSRSNILARQDADDTSTYDRFEKQYPFVLTHPEYAIVGTSWNNVDGNGHILCQLHPLLQPTAKEQAKGGSFMHPSWMMRKDQIAKVGYYTANKYTLRNQDYHLVMKVLAEGMALFNMPDILYNYTADEKMLKRTRDIKKVKGLMWIAWDSFRRNHLPFYYYIYVLKPLVVHMIPEGLMNRYHKRNFNGDVAK